MWACPLFLSLKIGGWDQYFAAIIIWTPSPWELKIKGGGSTFSGDNISYPLSISKRKLEVIQ